MPPYRPIASDVGSVSRALAGFLDHFLPPIARLLAIIQDLSLTSGTFTLDVASLYSNIPTEGDLQAVSINFLNYPDSKRKISPS